MQHHNVFVQLSSYAYLISALLSWKHLVFSDGGCAVLRLLQPRGKRFFYFTQFPFGCALQRLDRTGMIVMQDRVKLIG